MVEGMVARGYERDFAERCFRQIEGFGEYGFPESHAASFALLAYVSAWLKCHYPDIFACALLNSQPMGFYAPAQIVRDAREHGVEIRSVDINKSLWDHSLEPREGRTCALRLGLRQIKGLAQEDGARIVTARAIHPGGSFANIETLWRVAGVTRAVCERLARADAYNSLGLDRRGALWAVKGLGGGGGRAGHADIPLPLFAGLLDGVGEARPSALPHERDGEAVANDYGAIAMSLKDHPLRLLRNKLSAKEMVRNIELLTARPGRLVTLAGLILVRQRPGTAKGVIFMTLEDETGTANVIVWPDVFARLRKIVLTSRLVLVHGRLQRQGIVTHVIAREIEDRSSLLDDLALGKRPDRDMTGQALAIRDHGLAGRRKRRLKIPSRDFH